MEVSQLTRVQEFTLCIFYKFSYIFQNDEYELEDPTIIHYFFFRNIIWNELTMEIGKP